MTLGDQDIYNLLINDSTVTALLDTFGGSPAVFNSIIIPATTDATNYINFYQVSTLAGGEEYSALSYSVNCRAENQPKAKEIALAVFDLCNRHTTNGAFLRCDILPVIRPEDDSDVFNYPIDLFYRKK